jgi:hypothetical protein
MADIFVSYTSSDRDWAFWISHELEALGHIPHIHDWEIPGGGDLAAWMEERHQAADHIMCVVSTSYLSKRYSSWERRTAQWAAITDQIFFFPYSLNHAKRQRRLRHSNAATSMISKRRMREHVSTPSLPRLQNCHEASFPAPRMLRRFDF